MSFLLETLVLLVISRVAISLFLYYSVAHVYFSFHCVGLFVYSVVTE